jgi:hypothetical protein
MNNEVQILLSTPTIEHDFPLGIVHAYDRSDYVCISFVETFIQFMLTCSKNNAPSSSSKYVCSHRFLVKIDFEIPSNIRAPKLSHLTWRSGGILNMAYPSRAINTS